MKDQVIAYLKKNPNPSDEEFHEWAESRGFNVHKAEEAAYAILGRKLKGGDGAMKKEAGDKFFESFASELSGIFDKTAATGAEIKQKIQSSKGDTGPPGKGLQDPRVEARQKALQKAEPKVDKMPDLPGKGLKDPRPSAMRQVLKGVKTGLSKTSEISKEGRGLTGLLSKAKTDPKTKDFIQALAAKTKRKS